MAARPVDRSNGPPQQLRFDRGPAPPRFEIVFDGGAIGNPGRGYGSYKITGPEGYAVHEQLNYDHLGDRVTNNQAEYRTLVAALEELLRHLGDGASTSRLVVLGDSLLVINQLAGRWKVKNAGLAVLHQLAGSLLRRFGQSELVWHDRSNSVKILGH